MPLIFIPNLTMWDMKKYYSIDQKMIRVREHRLHEFTDRSTELISNHQSIGT